MSEFCDHRLVEIENDEEASEEYWGGPVPELIDFVLDQGLEKYFPAIQELHFDGASEVYQLTSLFWDGEDDAYDVSSFEGIEVCESLEAITVISMLSEEAPISLLPLSKLPNLERLFLGQGSFKGVEALLDAPAFMKVKIDEYVTLTDVDRDAFLGKLHDSLKRAD